eukprot:Em0328g5a
MAAIVDPRHKSLEWLKCHQQHTIPKQLLKEMFAVVGVPVDENPPANEDDAPNEPHVNVDALKTAIFLMNLMKKTSEVAAGADGLRRAVTGEFDAWLLVPEARTHGC